MKDYFDLLALVRQDAMDRVALVAAVRATFDRRGTALPVGVPFGLSLDFAADLQKQAQWIAFLRRNRLGAPDLGTVVAEIRAFLLALDL